MAANKIKQEAEEVAGQMPEATTTKKTTRSTKKARGILRFMSFIGMVQRDQVATQMPFILFIMLLLIFYIGNGYMTQQKYRDMDAMKKEVKLKREEFININSELMSISRQSAIRDKVAPMHLKENTVQPLIIKVQPKAK